MKCIKKMVSAITLFAFLSSSIPSYGAGDALAPYTNFIPHEKTEFKDIAQIQLGIMEALKDLPALNADTIRSLGMIKFEEKSKFGGRVRAEIYFNEADEVGIEAKGVSIEDGNYFFRAETKTGLTYHCLVSKKPDGPGVNVSIVSERVLAEALAKGDVKFTHASPDKKDREIVDLYLEHEVSPDNSMATDPFIEDKILNGEFAIDDGSADLPLYKGLKKKVYDKRNLLRLREEFAKFLEAVGVSAENIEPILRGRPRDENGPAKPFILIPYRDISELPVKMIGDTPVRVYGHTSVLADYAFIPQALFARVTGAGFWDKEVTDSVEEIYGHEKGAGCGKKAALKNGRIWNVVDEYFEQYRQCRDEGRLEEFHVPDPVREKMRTLASVNLLELEYRLDYAAGRTEENRKSMFKRVIGLVLVGAAVFGGWHLYDNARDAKERQISEEAGRKAAESAKRDAAALDARIKDLIVKLGEEDYSICFPAAHDTSKIGKPAVPYLIKALEDENGGRRRLAAKALGDMGAEAMDAVPALNKLAEVETNDNIRETVKSAIDDINGARSAVSSSVEKKSEKSPENAAMSKDEKIEWLIEKMGSKDLDECESAVTILVKMGKPIAPRLIKAFGDKNENVRMGASLAIRRMGKDIIPALIKALGDENSDLRSYVVVTLKRFGKYAVPDLAKALGDTNEEWLVRSLAAVTLGMIEPVGQDIVQTLAKALEDENNDVRNCAAGALGNIGYAAKAALPVLRKMAGKDVVPEIRDTAKMAIKNIEEARQEPGIDTAAQEEEIEKLISNLGGEDKDIRLSAAIALEGLGPAAIPALIKAVEGTNSMRGAMAASVLGSIMKFDPDSKEAMAGLIKALKSKNIAIVMSAGYAVKNIGPAAKDTVPVLTDILKDESEDELVLFVVSVALGEIGPAAKNALPELRKFAERAGDAKIVEVVRAVIQKIEAAESPAGSSEAEAELEARTAAVEPNVSELKEILWLVGNKAITPIEAKERLARVLPMAEMTSKERDGLFDEMINQAALAAGVLLGLSPFEGKRYAAPADDAIKGQIAPRLIEEGAHVFIPRSQFSNDTAKRYRRALEKNGGNLTLFDDARQLESMMADRNKLPDPKKAVVMLVGMDSTLAVEEFKKFEDLQTNMKDARFLRFERMEDFDKLDSEELKNYEDEILSILLAVRSMTKNDLAGGGSLTYQFLAHLLENYMPEGISVEDYIKDIATDQAKFIKNALKARPSSAYEVVRPAVDALMSV